MKGSKKVIGIDEMSLRKGHRDFMTTVTSRDKSIKKIRMLGVLEALALS